MTGEPPKTIAVAVEEQADGSIPKITASGRGHLAEKILEVAFAVGVKVRTDADLVQILAAVEVESEIPTEAFIAVTEVLTYVYRVNAQTPPDFKWSKP
jgi:flagellar biosynthesis protein